jgi:hypothetical protein
MVAPSTSTVVPSFEALVSFAETLHGKELRTIARSKPFFLVAEDGTLKITPGETTKQRTAKPHRIRASLKRLEDTGPFRPGEYKDASHNVSYLLALVRERQHAYRT